MNYTLSLLSPPFSVSFLPLHLLDLRHSLRLCDVGSLQQSRDLILAKPLAAVFQPDDSYEYLMLERKVHDVYMQQLGLNEAGLED